MRKMTGEIIWAKAVQLVHETFMKFALNTVSDTSCKPEEVEETC